MKQCTCYALRAVDCTCKPAKYGELYTSPTAKQEQGEPVAWMRQDGQRVTTASDRHNYPDYETRYSIPLYTTPYVPAGRQQRPSRNDIKPLTDEQIERLNLTAATKSDVRDIEAAHGIRPSDFKE
jgi:hypothetical protein